MRSDILVVLLFCFSMPTLAQTTYYVSESGSDEADGLTPATAFRSLWKAGTLSLGAGDQLLLERGSSWHGERLVLQNINGTAESPVIVGAYGTGANPTIYGSQPLNAANWTPVGGSSSVYSMPISGNANSMYAGTNFLLRRTIDVVNTTPGTWTRSGSNLYVNTGGVPIDQMNLQLGVIDRNLWVLNSRNFIVQDITARDSANNRDGESFKIDNSSDVTIRRLEAYNASLHHFEVVDTDNFVGEDLYAAVAEPGKGGTAYVSFSDSRSVSGHDDHVWRNIRYDDPSSYGLFVTHGPAMGDLLIENAFTTGDHQISIQTEGQNQSVAVRGGQVSGFSLNGDNVLIDGVKVTGPQALVEVNGNNNILQNMFLDITSLDFKRIAFAVFGDDNVIRFNTMILDPSVSTTSSSPIGLYVAPTGKADFYGNVLQNFPVDLQVDGELGIFEMNAYDEGVFRRSSGPVQTLAEWMANGFEQDSVEGPLSFVDSLGDDYRLEPGQPAYHLIPSNFVNRPLVDYLGQPISAHLPIDPGAFQSVVVPEASTWVLVGSGLLILAGARRRRS
jgi:hypothetical protein